MIGLGLASTLVSTFGIVLGAVAGLLALVADGAFPERSPRPTGPWSDFPWVRYQITRYGAVLLCVILLAPIVQAVGGWMKDRSDDQALRDTATDIKGKVNETVERATATSEGDIKSTLRDVTNKSEGDIKASVASATSRAGTDIKTTISSATSATDRDIKATFSRGTNDIVRRANGITAATQIAINNIERATSRIDEPSFSVAFDIDCTSPKYHGFCKATSDAGQSEPSWNNWPDGQSALIPLHALFFKDRRSARSFISMRESLGPRPDLDFFLAATNYAKDKSLNLERGISGPELAIFNYTLTGLYASDVHSSGVIISMRDLPGTVLVLTEINNELSRLHPTFFTMQVKDGEQLELGQGSFSRETLFNGNTAYSHEFPKGQALPNSGREGY